MPELPCENEPAAPMKIGATIREAHMNWREHIDRNPEVLSGKPKINGTRISVELILERLGDGWTIEQLLEAYSQINREQIQACLAYAAESLATDEIVDIPLSVA